MSTEDTLSGPAATLWDMDGTLVDTEPIWAQALKQTVAAWGGVWSADQAERAHGASAEATEELVRESFVGKDPRGTPSEFFAEVENYVLRELHHCVPVQPGARELISHFAACGIPQAIVTSSRMCVVRPIVQAFAPDVFDAVISDDMEIPSKPDPAPYVFAAKRLGVRIADCLIFEDSVPGLAAARASGARVWDVTQRPLPEAVRFFIPAGEVSI
ncbi:MAG: HAD family phosphatase [Ancrocorticia sp.]|jgi:haloacid dehalogenase superfamily, subfamily IA, variant 3 with third motif having DD or ED|nr:HAD family phosphatase [Ancrocorticia sp.]